MRSQNGPQEMKRIEAAPKQPGTAGPGNMLGYCLVSFHFLWAILSTSTVHPSNIWESYSRAWELGCLSGRLLAQFVPELCPQRNHGISPNKYTFPSLSFISDIWNWRFSNLWHCQEQWFLKWSSRGIEAAFSHYRSIWGINIWGKKYPVIKMMDRIAEPAIKAAV